VGGRELLIGREHVRESCWVGHFVGWFVLEGVGVVWIGLSSRLMMMFEKGQRNSRVYIVMLADYG
jgi:hypothetical protein